MALVSMFRLAFGWGKASVSTLHIFSFLWRKSSGIDSSSRDVRISNFAIARKKFVDCELTLNHVDPVILQPVFQKRIFLPCLGLGRAFKSDDLKVFVCLFEFERQCVFVLPRIAQQ